MVKRILSILLSLALVFGLCLSGLAEAPAMPQGDFGQSDGGQGGDFAPSDGGQGGDFAPSDGSQGGDFAPSDGSQGGDFGSSDGSQGGFGDMDFSGSFGGQAVEGQLGSWGNGGTDASSLGGDDYAYDAALFIDADGVNAEKSAAERIASGEYDGAGAKDIQIIDSASGHNGVIVTQAAYTISGAAIELITDADGTDTCDFSGKGTAVAAFGENGKVVLENSTVRVAGVAALPIFADSGATLTVISSKLRSDGGTLYKEYLSTPDQKLMVAPPWILGIMGTSQIGRAHV